MDDFVYEVVVHKRFLTPENGLCWPQHLRLYQLGILYSKVIGSILRCVEMLLVATDRKAALLEAAIIAWLGNDVIVNDKIELVKWFLN